MELHEMKCCPNGKLELNKGNVKVYTFLCSDCGFTVLSDIAAYLNRACTWRDHSMREIYSYLREDKKG